MLGEGGKRCKIKRVLSQFQLFLCRIKYSTIFYPLHCRHFEREGTEFFFSVLSSLYVGSFYYLAVRHQMPLEVWYWGKLTSHNAISPLVAPTFGEMGEHLISWKAGFRHYWVAARGAKMPSAFSDSRVKEDYRSLLAPALKVQVPK